MSRDSHPEPHLWFERIFSSELLEGTHTWGTTSRNTARTQTSQRITNLLSWNLLIEQLARQWPEEESLETKEDRMNTPTCSYVRLSPITPTALTGSKTANAWLIWSYSPAFRISSLYILSASWRILTCSRVTGPRIRIANPGPGKGWRCTRCCGIERRRPSALTSSSR